MTPAEAAAQEQEIQARVAARLAQQPQPMQPAAGWAPPQQQMQPAGAMAQGGCTGVLIPVEITGPDGRQVTVQLHYGPEYAPPQALMALIGQLMQQGVPVRAFAPKQQGNWGGGNGGGYQNNYRNGGGNGGYGRRW
jgi:hypothetical protein